MKVAVCSPCYGDPKARFVQSLLSLQAQVLSSRITYNGVELTPDLQVMLYPGCSRVDLARNQLADAALQWGADYILWLDADQTFPSDALFRLAAHDVPIVGCNYAVRGERDAPESTAFNIAKNENGLLRIEPKETGLEAVDVIGMGVCLVKRVVFEALPRPWFRPFDYGEDGYFCLQAKKAGFIPHVDHSLKVGHIDETIRMLPQLAAS
jgi:hypothetical protein